MKVMDDVEGLYCSWFVIAAEWVLMQLGMLGDQMAEVVILRYINNQIISRTHE